MDPILQSVVGAIHASPTRAVVYVAGGASQALAWLLSVPRASETILEASVPYCRLSMAQLLGKTPSQYVSKETAEDIAMAAYNRSLRLSIPGTPVAGIGFTGALVSASPKRGDHRCYVCARTQDRLLNYEFTFTKGLRNRIEEDKLASQILIKALAHASGINHNVPLDCKQGESLMETVTSFDEDEQIRQLLAGTICMVPYTYGSGALYKEDERRIILSGSFNPLHEGHLKLMDIACSMVPGVPCFEISVINADKPPLCMEDIKLRARQFKEAGKTVVFSNQPYFFKKAEIFPYSTFVIGADTAVRLINPKYYDGSHSRMLEVLLGVQQLGCDFLVAGRKTNEKFLVLSDLDIPSELEGLFKSVPTDKFRVDISSTEIREKNKLDLGKL